MKKRLMMLILCIGLTLAPTQQSHAIWWWVAKAAIKKAIKAADLAIQKQQNKVIWLQNAQKSLENAMGKLKLNEISEWSEKQRKLYDQYFQELWKVKNAIATYQKIKGIINRQLLLVEEYKNAWTLLQRDENFTPREIRQMFRVYSGIIDESLKNIDELLLVANSFATQMSDGKRLELITQADANLEQNLVDLRKFNNQNFRISISRTTDAHQVQILKKIYGLD
ncbi:conjugal transfer protein TraI [Chitinophaga sp. RCC_12]|uniref:conjugal transfer protein TraI n=1 Tax=Chitinophaga sp. RCC_12 TaxID=3239226 RepID=UPI003525D204